MHGFMWTAYAVTGDNKFLYLDTSYGAYNWFATPTSSQNTA